MSPLLNRHNKRLYFLPQSTCDIQRPHTLWTFNCCGSPTSVTDLRLPNIITSYLWLSNILIKFKPFERVRNFSKPTTTTTTTTIIIIIINSITISIQWYSKTLSFPRTIYMSSHSSFLFYLFWAFNLGIFTTESTKIIITIIQSQSLCCCHGTVIARVHPDHSMNVE